MSVDPLKSHALSSTDAGRLGASASARRGDSSAGAETPAEPTSGTGDSVQLSAASRTLVESVDEVNRVPRGTLSPDRLREVLRRLDSEFYSTPEARDKVARGVRQDLGLSTTE